MLIHKKVNECEGVLCSRSSQWMVHSRGFSLFVKKEPGDALNERTSEVGSLDKRFKFSIASSASILPLFGYSFDAFITCSTGGRWFLPARAIEVGV